MSSIHLNTLLEESDIIILNTGILISAYLFMADDDAYRAASILSSYIYCRKVGTAELLSQPHIRRYSHASHYQNRIGFLLFLFITLIIRSIISSFSLPVNILTCLLGFFHGI